MAELIITTTKRVFKLNGRMLEDPDPAMSIEDVKDLYANQYPEMTNAKVEEPEISEDGQTATYNIVPERGKNG